MKPAEGYILNQPEPFRSILMHLQLMIENAVPETVLQFKWKVPFYYLNNKPFCYLNVTKGYVDVGFWDSSCLAKYDEFLVSKGRKFVKSLRYFSLDEIDQEILFLILEEVKKVNQQRF